jgi:hypothetical protein
MQCDPERPTAQRGNSSSASPAVEDHGRAVTANIQAAAFACQAQQSSDASVTRAALHHSVTADPTFGLAMADLDALTKGLRVPHPAAR